MNSDSEKLKQAIDSADIISFDIFDTLVLRMTARPEDIFRIVEKKTGVRGFAKKRELMQAECSRMTEQTTGAPHCTFDELYEYMGKKAYTGRSRRGIEALKRAELSTEAGMLVRNRLLFEAFEYAKKAGKRVIAVSDMYMGKKELVPLLKKCGYEGFGAIYSSADTKKTKYRGDMFAYVAEKEGVSPHRILHIGDNMRDDCENAKKRGLSAFHISSDGAGEYLPLYRSIAAGVSKAIENNTDEGFWYRLGARVGGPLYCGLIMKLKRIIEKRRPEKVFFLSRDGYNLFSIMNAMPHNVPYSYMYASRRSMLLCGIDRFDSKSKRLLPPFTFGQSVRELLEYLDMSEISAESVKKAGFVGLDSVIAEPADFDKFKSILENSSDIFFKTAAGERKQFQKYLRRIGFFGAKALVFDCGWNGSSQYLLDRALRLMDDKKGTDRFVYAGIMLTRKSLRQLFGKKYDAILFDILKNRRLYLRLRRSIVLLELFFGAPEGSLWKYEKSGLKYENIEREHEYKLHILRGIKDFVTAALPLYEELGSVPTAEDCLAEVFRLIEHPTPEEAVIIGDLENVDGFAARSGQKKYIAKLTPEDIKDVPNELYWPQGIYTRPDIEDRVKEFVRRKTGVEMTERKKRAAKRPNVISRVLGYVRSYGPAATAFLIKNKLNKSISEQPYNAYIEAAERDILKTGPLEYCPLFSFVVPVYNVEEKFLRECIESVLKQTYSNYELILADDSSTDENVRRVLAEYEDLPAVKVIYRAENGHISRCTNTAIEAAKGEYIVFMDCDDTAAPNAVYELTRAVNADRSIDFIYSDEDKLDENGRRHFPHFKPDWSPDTLMSLMYTSHLSAYRRSIVNELGGLRTGFEGAQDYDLTLRFTEKTDRVCHIPKVLYHWRQREESTASSLGAKPYVMQAMEKLKREALERRGLKGEVVLVPKVSQYRVVYDAAGEPLVSVIIPSKDNYDMLERCIITLSEKTEYRRFEIVVVDNGSSGENREKYQGLCDRVGAVYKHSVMPFNFAKMCNIGAETAKGEYLLFLNDDTEVTCGGWLRAMLGQASLKHAGAVGAKLLYPNSTTIQHCGILNLPIGPCHALMPLDDTALHYFCRNSLDYNYIAVTAACLCVSRDKFNEVGGFDESFEVGYNDIDLCFKLYEAGYYNSVRTDAVLYHHESVSRGFDIADPQKQQRLNAEMERLYKKHPALRGHDPFYSSNLAGNRTDFALGEAACSRLSGAGIEVNRLRSDKVRAKLETLNTGDTIEVSGWAFIDGVPFNNLNRKRVLLVDENGLAVAADTKTMLRLDVSAAHGKGVSLNLSGFSCRIDRGALQAGRYRLGIMLENTAALKRCAYLFDRWVEVF